MYLQALPSLEASDQLAGISAVNLAMNPKEAKQAIRELQKQAAAHQPAKKATPADLAGMGIEVQQ